MLVNTISIKETFKIDIIRYRHTALAIVDHMKTVGADAYEVDFDGISFCSMPFLCELISNVYINEFVVTYINMSGDMSAMMDIAIKRVGDVKCQ